MFNQVLLLFIALSLAACETPTPVQAPPRPVRVMAVHYAQTLATARYTGEVKVRREPSLAFQVNGKLAKRLVDVGATVRLGQVLATLDPPDYQLNQASSAAQLHAAETELSQARKDLQHSANLLAQSLTSPAHHERRMDAVRVAEAHVAQAQAALALTARQSAYVELRADGDGVITAVEAEAGQIVAAGQSIFKLAHTLEKEVVINVPENRLDDLRAATSLKASLWAKPDVFYAAKLREISPGADALLRTFTVKLALPDADEAVRMGMTATVQVERRASHPLAWLPLTALTARDGQPTVWVVDAKLSVHPQPVKIGVYAEDKVSIIEGLDEGQSIVVAGVHKLTQGQTVRVLTEAGQ